MFRNRVLICIWGEGGGWGEVAVAFVMKTKWFFSDIVFEFARLFHSETPVNPRYSHDVTD